LASQPFLDDIGRVFRGAAPCNRDWCRSARHKPDGSVRSDLNRDVRANLLGCTKGAGDIGLSGAGWSAGHSVLLSCTALTQHHIRDTCMPSMGGLG
jgi:hypothetical protein